MEILPRPFRLEGVLFDFDGTLTRPEALDFALIRREVGCPDDTYVLEYVLALPEGGERAAALAALERFELMGAAQAEPNPGAEDLVRRLRGLGLRLGVITRSGRAAVGAVFARFAELGIELRPADFEVIVTRDDDLPHKPAPDGVLHAAALMGVAPDRLLMVGDYHLDVQAGDAAGALTVYLENSGGPARPAAPGPDDDAAPPAADFLVHSLDEVDDVVHLGLPLPEGKLPNDLLRSYLRRVTGGTAPDAARDPTVIVGAGVGEDVAAIDVSRDEVIVVHGDPITLTSAKLGRYSVLVNANDIATSGALPRWLLTTVLLPPGTTSSEALALLGGIVEAAADLGIAVVGGHTEITDVIARPLVSATMIGTLARADLRDKRRAAAGDRVLLTKAIAVEGTALLAAELGGKLRALGMTDAELDVCLGFFERISVLPEARVAATFAGVHALHDVTEGGLATALEELAIASGRRLTVHPASIPVYPETRRVCDLLGADPRGLIASGSLLVCCAQEETDALQAALRKEGITATVIAELGEEGSGVVAQDDGRTASWPRFARDEAVRLL
jgi:hydrogenase expression/formation protein HypE